jgi:hypothetical protein
MIYEPAFPDSRRAGMSLRDYFAAEALAALLTRVALNDPHQVAAMASDAYRLADALLEARKQRPANDRGPVDDQLLHDPGNHDAIVDGHARRGPARPATPLRYAPEPRASHPPSPADGREPLGG